MKTPAQYEHELNEVHYEEVIAEGSPEKLAEAEEKLRHIETSLHLDLHALRAQFQGRQAALSMQNTQRGGHNRVDDEQRLGDERESKLTPYEEVKKRIESTLQQLEQARNKLEKSE
ncbi:MAG: hypothetical protein PHQ40_09205 [Anaerolineaceae bacterium]|nr:hypothetical protein [Anaerolineaceae bacterium]